MIVLVTCYQENQAALPAGLGRRQPSKRGRSGAPEGAFRHGPCGAERLCLGGWGTAAPGLPAWPCEERLIPAASPAPSCSVTGCTCFRVMKSIIMQPIFLDEASCLRIDSYAYKYCEFLHGFISLASNSTITANLLDFQSSANVFPGARCLAKILPKNS